MNRDDPQQDLLIGAAYGSIEQMTEALAQGARLDEALPPSEDPAGDPGFAGYHALGAAVFFGKVAAVKWLLERGARIDAQCACYALGSWKPFAASFTAAPAGPGSIMHLATRAFLPTAISKTEHSQATLALLQLLHAAGANPALRDADGATPLHRAAEAKKRGDVATFLLDIGCPLDVVDRAGWTALDRATEISFVEVLLARGADPNGKAPPCGAYERFYSGGTIPRGGNLQPLSASLYRREHDIAAARLRHGARATPHALYLAAAHAQTELIEALLRAGADPNDRRLDEADEIALAAAVRSGEVRSVEALLQAGARVDEGSFQQSEAEVGGKAAFALIAPRVDRAARSRVLIRLAGVAPLGQLEALVECGVDLDATLELPSHKGPKPYTALRRAKELGNDRHVAYLLRQASEAVAATAASMPALQVGRRARHVKFGSGIVQHIESGSSPDRKVKVQFEDGVTRTLLARFLQPA